MTELRSHLSSLHRHYHAAYYPGDLAADVRRSAWAVPRWLGAVGIGASALAAGVTLFFALDTSQLLPWENAVSAAPASSVSVPLTFPSRPGESADFEMVPSLGTFSLPEAPANEPDRPASTSQESA
jgi:hypothetical protein